MASYTEGTQHIKIPRGSTFVATDDSGTNDWTFRLAPGTVSMTPGGYTIVRGMDESGDMLTTTRKGGQAGPSTISVSAKVYDAGGASSPTGGIVNFLTGNFPSAWTSTDSDSDFVLFEFSINIPAVGSIDGANYSLTNCTIQPGWSLSNATDGYDVSFTIESPDAEITVTENAGS